jgi:hypothetical protein
LQLFLRDQLCCSLHRQALETEPNISKLDETRARHYRHAEDSVWKKFDGLIHEMLAQGCRARVKEAL